MENEVTATTLCHAANRAGGALLGIGKMVKENRSDYELTVAIAAVQRNVNYVICQQFMPHIRLKLLRKAESAAQLANLTAVQSDFIGEISRNLNNYSLSELTRIFYRLDKIEAGEDG